MDLVVLFEIRLFKGDFNPFPVVVVKYSDERISRDMADSSIHSLMLG